MVIESSYHSALDGGLRTTGRFKRSLPEAPLVTIVTVVRNCAATIEQCIQSVLSQTYENIEYLVIDGASTDGTREILKRFASALDYFISEPDSGIYDAMNKGLQLATGDYILFLNADDWYSHDAVALLVGKALEHNAEITHADAWVVDESGRPLRELPGWLNDGIYTLGMPLRHETMLITRDVYDTLGEYDDSYQIIADYVWTLKAYDAGVRFAHLEEKILWFRLVGVSNTDHAKRIAERMRLYAKMFPFLDSQDLRTISDQANFTIEKKHALVEKHRGKSEVFERSMAFNIEYSRIRRPVRLLYRILQPLRKSAIWPWIAPSLRRIKTALRI